jgi:heme-degrading monooxygenase HmoA
LIALFCGVGLVVALIMASMGFDLGAEFSHTIWESRSVFEAWTKSEAFRAAHSRAGDNKPLYLDHPQFEGFEVRQTVGRKNAA